MSLYRQRGQTTYLVAEDEGALWIVPARLGGWRDRTPFRGLRASLVAATDPESRVLAATAGVPR